MTPRRLILIVAGAAALAAAVGGALAFGPDLARLALGREASAPVLARSASNDPLAGLDPDAVARLTAASPDAPSRFLWLPWPKPADFCRGLKEAGLGNPTFEGGEGAVRDWTCIADMLKPVDGDEGTVSSLFFSARGADPDRIDAIRIKLNLLDRGTTPVVKSIAKDILRKIFWGLGWRAPEPVLTAIDALKDAHVEHRGVSFDLKREFGEPPRFNLIVVFPQRISAGGQARFVEINPPGR